jgi:hypothetical protein
VDVWWNEAIEKQAFGRIFRIGQESKTSLTRLFAHNSIDERIKKLQDMKRINISQVMSDDKRDEQLGLSELLKLFGDVTMHGGGEEDGQSYFVVGENRREDRTIFEDDAYALWEPGAKPNFFGGK